jgi:hypothetical protein
VRGIGERHALLIVGIQLFALQEVHRHAALFEILVELRITQAHEITSRPGVVFGVLGFVRVQG